MKKEIKKQLQTHCARYWWNFGEKTKDFDGTLEQLLSNGSVKFSVREDKASGLFNFTFKNDYGITFKCSGSEFDFSNLAKKFLQMELVRMGDKATLYVAGTCRSVVTVNH